MWSNNNNSIQQSPPSSKNIGDSGESPIISEDDPDVIQLEDDTEDGNTQEEPVVINYMYNSMLVDTSVICDLGFRNMESIARLTKDDVRSLEETEFEKLSLSHNALKKIPHNFFSRHAKLQTLLVLDLSCNQLVFVPNDIDHLVNLTHLNLFLNKLRCLPPSLGRLSHLKWLNLAKNPELFKSEYLSDLAGPMVTDEQCHLCAVNVKKWINSIMERRVRDFRSEIQNGGRPSINRVEDAGLRTDEYLIRYYPDNTRELRPPDGNFTFVDEETPSYDFEYGAIKKQASALRTFLNWATKLWLISTLVTLGVSSLVGPFIMNESTRKFYTSQCLLFIPQVLTEVAIAMGKAFHDLLWGVPCQFILKDSCTYCNPKVPDFWDLVLWKWVGS